MVGVLDLRIADDASVVERDATSGAPGNIRRVGDHDDGPAISVQIFEQ